MKKEGERPLEMPEERNKRIADNIRESRVDNIQTSRVQKEIEDKVRSGEYRLTADARDNSIRVVDKNGDTIFFYNIADVSEEELKKLGAQTAFIKTFNKSKEGPS